MYQNSRIKLPTRTDYNYVIYFYESGLSKQYQQRQKDLWAGLSYGPAGSYDFSSDLSVRRPWPKPQTVEDVVRNGYLSIPKSEPETAIISDWKNTSWLGLDDLIGQIRNRFQVYENNLYGKARVSYENSNLILRFGQIDSPLEHMHSDTFRITAPLLYIGRMPVTFVAKDDGTVDKFNLLRIIDFKRVPEK